MLTRARYMGGAASANSSVGDSSLARLAAHGVRIRRRVRALLFADVCDARSELGVALGVDASVGERALCLGRERLTARFPQRARLRQFRLDALDLQLGGVQLGLRVQQGREIQIRETHVCQLDCIQIDDLAYEQRCCINLWGRCFHGAEPPFDG